MYFIRQSLQNCLFLSIAMATVKGIPECIIYCRVLAVLYCNGCVIVFPCRIVQLLLRNSRILEYQLCLSYKIFLTLPVTPVTSYQFLSILLCLK